MSRAKWVRSKRRPKGSMPSPRRVSILFRRTFNNSFCSSSLVMTYTPSGSTGDHLTFKRFFPLTFLYGPDGTTLKQKKRPRVVSAGFHAQGASDLGSVDKKKRRAG